MTGNDELFRFCDTPGTLRERALVSSCVENIRRSVMKSISFQSVYLFCIEIVLYIVFGVILQDFSPAKVFGSGCPVMCAVLVLFVTVFAAAYHRAASTGKRIMRSFLREPKAARVSSGIFIFEEETDQRTGGSASDGHIRSLRFSYRDGQAVRYVSFEKRRKGFFYDELKPGGQYRFLLIAGSYFLAAKAL